MTPLGVQGADAVGEADGLADVAYPVAGGGQLAVGQVAGDVGDDRDTRGVVGQRLRDRAEVVEHRVHERRVEGVR